MNEYITKTTHAKNSEAPERPVFEQFKLSALDCHRSSPLFLDIIDHLVDSLFRMCHQNEHVFRVTSCVSHRCVHLREL